MLIGFLGHKQSGKDTASDYLVKKLNYKKVSFASPLKDACMILFGFNHEQLYGNKKEEIDDDWGVSPRKVMQWMGTDMFRVNIQSINPDIKNNFWITSFKKRNPYYKNIVISDVRFQNEVNAIHELGGLVIKIERPNINTDAHVSEFEINTITNYDTYINNNANIESLYQKLDNIIYVYKLSAI